MYHYKCIYICPRGEQLRGEKADNVVVQGYHRENPQRTTEGIKSTLYKTIPGDVNMDIEKINRRTCRKNILFTTVGKNCPIHTF